MPDYFRLIWSGRLDLNQRPPEPHSGTLPDCATPRYILFLSFFGRIVNPLSSRAREDFPIPFSLQEERRDIFFLEAQAVAAPPAEPSVPAIFS